RVESRRYVESPMADPEFACPFCSRGRGVPPFTCPCCKTSIPGRLVPRKKTRRSRAEGPVAPMSRERFDAWIEELFQQPSSGGCSRAGTYLRSRWAPIRDHL